MQRGGEGEGLCTAAVGSQARPPTHAHTPNQEACAHTLASSPPYNTQSSSAGRPSRGKAALPFLLAASTLGGVVVGLARVTAKLFLVKLAEEVPRMAAVPPPA